MILLTCSVTACDGCDDSGLQPTDPDAGTPAGLTREQAALVLARVGDKEITLGDYAAALERMNEQDRLRYQSKERRRLLLDEMIDRELLAQEAKRRGLDDREEVKEAIRQILREAMLAKAREGVPPPATFTQAEIRAWYEAHSDRFREPERRRITAIRSTDREALQEALDTLKEDASAKAWGDAYWTYHADRPPVRDERAPDDLAGDLGLVGPPGTSDPRLNKELVPAAVHAAVFTLKEVGDVHDSLVAADGFHYIVRLSGITPERVRTLEEVEQKIRGELFNERIQERYAALEEELRKQFPVSVDDEALASVPIDMPPEDAASLWERAPASEPAGEDGAP